MQQILYGFRILMMTTCAFQRTATLCNPLKTKRILLHLKTHSAPRSKHFSSWL